MHWQDRILKISPLNRFSEGAGNQGGIGLEKYADASAMEWFVGLKTYYRLFGFAYVQQQKMQKRICVRKLNRRRSHDPEWVNLFITPGGRM